MLTINEAVNSGKLYKLALCVSELELTEDIQVILVAKKVLFVWQLARKTKKWLRDTAWMSENQISAVSVALKSEGLRLRTGLDPLLVDLLTIGKFKLPLWEEDDIVVALVQYANRPDVSEDTRRIIFEQRDIAKPRIEAERRHRSGGTHPLPVGEDTAGLMRYYDHGIIAY